MKKIISMTLALAMVATSGASFAGASEAHSRDGRYERYHHDRSYDRHRDYDRRYHDDRRYRERRRNNDAEIAAAGRVMARRNVRHAMTASERARIATTATSSGAPHVSTRAAKPSSHLRPTK